MRKPNRPQYRRPDTAIKIQQRQTRRKYKENGAIDGTKLLSKEEYAMQGDKINHNDAAAYYNQGNAYVRKDNLDQAISDYTKAIKINPGYADAYSNRGNALSALKRHQEALVSYGRAIVLKPDYAQAYNNQGIKRHEQVLFKPKQAAG